jgi:hypothetical protein
MSNFQVITPQGQDYIRAIEIFQNLTYNTKDLTLGANMAAASGTPFMRLDGFGMAYLQGQITIDTASVSANMILCTFPNTLSAQRTTYHPVVVLRSGVFVSNAVKIDSSNNEVILLTAPQQNDVVVLDSVNFMLNSYAG